MPHRITIESSRHQFDVEPGNTLLRAALDAGINLPYGCRNGACGACKGRVVSGQIDRGDYAEDALSETEVARGYALFCCARPLSDLVIACREVGSVRDIPVKAMPCRVQKMALLASDVMLLQLKLPTSERLQYLAGQYIDILLRGGRRRSFSIANAPQDDDFLELHVRRVPGGHFTRHVFETMQERDILRIEGPHGSFFLREESAKPIILLAGGTGFAPIKALIEQAWHQPMRRPMTLYWGARDRAGLYMQALAESWVSEHDGFGFVPVLSEAQPADGWLGRSGWVHQAVVEDLPDLSGHQVYASGSPAMIDAARHDFISRCGLKDEDFFADAFTFAAESVSP